MIRTALLALVLAGAPVAAEACMRPIDTPAERMAEGRWVTIALARVVAVEPRDATRPNRDFNARFEIERVVEGYPASGQLRLFHREMTECPVVLPLPVVGDTWVVYQSWRSEDGGLIDDAWPLTWSERVDPRFGGRTDADMRDLEPPHR